VYSIEEFDKAKSKVLKYVLYKKRSKQEVKNKFYNVIDSEMLNNVIEELEENGYIDDCNYIERAVNEFMVLNNLSIKEIRYKLATKGIPSNLIDDYIIKNKETLVDYEFESARKITIKKSSCLTKDEIMQYLLKKGYMKESVGEALKELD
jgi:SOS response regulatory protein OraA/RecX